MIKMFTLSAPYHVKTSVFVNPTVEERMCSDIVNLNISSEHARWLGTHRWTLAVSRASVTQVFDVLAVEIDSLRAHNGLYDQKRGGWVCCCKVLSIASKALKKDNQDSDEALLVELLLGYRRDRVRNRKSFVVPTEREKVRSTDARVEIKVNPGVQVIYQV